MAFDYGADCIESKGMKNPSVGAHWARVRSIIHLGPIEGFYLGKSTGVAPTVVVICELKGKSDFDDDGVTPLTLDKDMPLKSGDKATVQKFRAAIDPAGTSTGFDDLIGKAVQVTAKGGKDKNEDGTPKYVNLSEFTPLVEDVIDVVPELQEAGVGHCTFDSLTKEAIMELHPIRHIANMMMKSIAYKGSGAEAIINEIRVENPDFAKPKDKEDDGKSPNKPDNPTPPPADMDDSKEY